MATFKVEIQEFLSRIVKIKAENISDAISIVEEKYKKAEVVLDYNDFVEVNFVNKNKQSKKDELNQLIKEVVEYLYVDEERHFEESDKPKNHIFSKIKRIKDLTN